MPFNEDRAGVTPLPPNCELLSQQLANAVSFASKQDQIVWTVFGLFWAASAALLGTFLAHDPASTKGRQLAMFVTGLASAGVWALIQRRAIAYLNFYDGVIEELETRLGFDGDRVALSTALNPKLREHHVKGMSVRPLMAWCPAVVVAIWLVALAWCSI